MGRLFGTDGVRGVANVDLTSELALQIGRAAAMVLLKESKSAKPTVLIGKDTEHQAICLKLHLQQAYARLVAMYFRSVLCLLRLLHIWLINTVVKQV